MPNLALELGKQTASIGVTSVYGEQQDVDGVRLIPVALTWSGFGAGAAPPSWVRISFAFAVSLSRFMAASGPVPVAAMSVLICESERP